MNKVLLTLSIMVLSGSLLAQESPTTPKAPRVQIIQGPEIALASWFTIIRWTTNNPGGSPVHYGIVYYGTDPRGLSETTKSPIRLNPGHASTVFRVRIDGLRPRTTYYYTLDSIEANGKGDGGRSAVKHVATPCSRKKAVSTLAYPKLAVGSLPDGRPDVDASETTSSVG